MSPAYLFAKWLRRTLPGLSVYFENRRSEEGVTTIIHIHYYKDPTYDGLVPEHFEGEILIEPGEVVTLEGLQDYWRHQVVPDLIVGCDELMSEGRDVEWVVGFLTAFGGVGL